MIQFNLLPDVKLEFIKAQRTRRLVFSVSIIVTAASVGLLLLLLVLVGLQKKHLNDLNTDIKSNTSTLEKKPNIKTILTVQNQLGSLTGLHDQKPAADRLFTYMNQVTPAAAAITNLDVDYAQNTMVITGTADALKSVNKYVDTLKFTTFSVAGAENSSKAFSNVVLTSFGLTTGTKDPAQAATYSISLSYDPVIFDITKSVALSVPTITTRAETPNPTDLFKASTNGSKP